MLLWHARRPAFSAGARLRSGYLAGAGYFSFMLITYPIAWACAEGGNVISVTSEMIWYGILDLLTGPVFLFVFLWKLRGVNYAAFGLQSGKWTDPTAAVENGIPATNMATATMAPATAAPLATKAPATTAAPAHAATTAPTTAADPALAPAPATF